VYLRGKGYPHGKQSARQLSATPFFDDSFGEGENFAEETRKGNCFAQGGPMQCNTALINVQSALAGAISMRIGNNNRSGAG